MIVYIVTGMRGMYSGSQEWPVRVLRDEARAKQLAADATAHAAAITKDEALCARLTGGPTEADLDFLAKFDSTLVYTIEHGPRKGQRDCGVWTPSGEEVEYTVVPCEMEDA